MIDVFTEEIEVLIKQGITNLYWFLGDLEKSWLRAGVDQNISKKLFSLRHDDGKKYSKRELMDCLYIKLRSADYNRRLEISRNFVKFLVEHRNFVPQADGHRIGIAETCSLKLQKIIDEQNKQAEYNQEIRHKTEQEKKPNYHNELIKLKDKFLESEKLAPQPRGYELENIFYALMKISSIPVEESFKIIGEQIDGAIKYEGHYYLVEIKWTDKVAAHKEVASLYMKVEGKMEARGIFISMNGYSGEIIQSLPRGKDIKVLLFDGVHLTNVIYGLYTFQELLEHAISQASVKGEIYCSHDLNK